MFDSFARAPHMRPFLNIGFPFDIVTGRYYDGKDGESVLNGGLQHFTGVAGQGNLFKSTLAHHMNLTVLDRYVKARSMVYDTEPPSCTYPRFEKLAARMPFLSKTVLEDRLLLTDTTVVIGNEWFAQFKKAVEHKKAWGKEGYGKTPFYDEKGQQISVLLPNVVEVDSLSMMTLDVVNKIFDENDIGDSGANMEAMRGQAAKTQMLMQLPNLTTGSNTFVIMTAHAGRTYQIDARTPIPKMLSFLKAESKLKNVPEKFTFLTNNLWYAVSASTMINQTTKAPEYPRSSEDDMKGDTDLMLVTYVNLRAKNGPSGLPVELVISQSEGYHPGLTALSYLKKYDRYGLGGHDKSYYLELCPNVKLQRTTVRGKLDADPKLARAMEITGEMCQMLNLWHDMPKEVLCTPKELYDSLVIKGYDWDQLLDTRGYWIFEGDEHPQPYLSTKDLLMMRLGKYQPKWAKLDNPHAVTKEQVGLEIPQFAVVATDKEAMAGVSDAPHISPVTVAENLDTEVIAKAAKLGKKKAA